MRGWGALARTLLLVTTTAVTVTGSTGAVADSSSPGQTGSVVVRDGTVRLLLSVRSSPGAARLDPSSVTVSADGKPWSTSARTVSSSSGTVVRTALLVIDTSGSMSPRLAAAQTAALHFLQIVPDDVRVGLVTFADRASLVVAPTLRRPAVASALRAMRANGQTALYDGIRVGLAALGTRGDRALIVLSDGLDTRSRASLTATKTALKRSGASVDLVSFGSGGQQQALQQLAAAASGRVQRAESSTQLRDVFAVSAGRLADQVVVTARIPADFAGGPSELTVRASAGRETVVSSLHLTLPASAPASGVAAPQGDLPVLPAGEPPWVRPLVLGVAFLALFLLFALGLASSTWKASPSGPRTREIARYRIAGTGAAGPAQVAPAAVARVALAWAGRAVQRRGLENSWGEQLDRAGLPLKPQEWLILRLGAAVSGVAVAVVLLPLPLLTAPTAGLAAWFATHVFLRVRTTRRANRFADNLPDVLQLVAGSLRSGFSLPQAVDNAARDGEQPMAGELSRALAEARLGMPLEDALDRVAERMCSTDLTWTVMAVRIAREVGGNLAEVLLTTAETMRERGRIQRQVKVLSAEGRLSAYVLVALPIGITGFMALFRSSYIAPLVSDPLGWAMTVYAVLSVLVGGWWMSRMIKLEV